MDVLIRKYEITDYFKVNDILKEAFNITKVNTNPGDGYVELVADYLGEAIGYLVISEILDVVKGENYFLIDYVAVDSKYRNNGVASKMVDAAIDFCKEKGGSYIELTSSRIRCQARHIYQKKGFEIRDTDVFRKGLV